MRLSVDYRGFGVNSPPLTGELAYLIKNLGGVSFWGELASEIWKTSGELAFFHLKKFRAPSAREKNLDPFLLIFPCKTAKKGPNFSRAPKAREFFSEGVSFFWKNSGGVRFWGELAEDLRKTPGELALITPVKGGELTPNPR